MLIDKIHRTVTIGGGLGILSISTADLMLGPLGDGTHAILAGLAIVVTVVVYGSKEVV